LLSLQKPAFVFQCTVFACKQRLLKFNLTTVFAELTRYARRWLEIASTKTAYREDKNRVILHTFSLWPPCLCVTSHATSKLSRWACIGTTYHWRKLANEYRSRIGSWV